MTDLVIDVILDPEFELDAASTVVDVAPVEPVLAVITVDGPKGDKGDTGAPGDGAQVFGETLAGADGSRTVFTTANPYASGTTAVFLNGLREVPGDAYTETTSNTITFDDPPLSDDSVRIDYTIQ